MRLKSVGLQRVLRDYLSRHCQIQPENQWIYNQFSKNRQLCINSDIERIQLRKILASVKKYFKNTMIALRTVKMSFHDNIPHSSRLRNLTILMILKYSRLLTRNSSPSRTVFPSGGWSFAVAPGSNEENIDAKFLLTWKG